MTDYSLGDVVKYLIYSNGGNVDGIKKLVKLLFLVQYDKGIGKVKKYLYDGRPITHTEFYIWNYGPFSNEIYDVIDGLKINEEGYKVLIGLPDDFDPREVTDKLPVEVMKRIRRVVKKYGKKKGYELEGITLKLLKLDKELKKEYYKGYFIDDSLR